MLLRNWPGCGVTVARPAEGDLIDESCFGQRVLVPLRKSLRRSFCPRCQSEVSRRIPSRASFLQKPFTILQFQRDRLLDLAAARICPRTFNANVGSGRFLSCDPYSSLRSARAIGTGGARCMGVARAASERACVHPDRGSACLIPDISGFMSLFA